MIHITPYEMGIHSTRYFAPKKLFLQWSNTFQSYIINDNYSTDISDSYAYSKDGFTWKCNDDRYNYYFNFSYFIFNEKIQKISDIIEVLPQILEKNEAIFKNFIIQTPSTYFVGVKIKKEEFNRR